MHLEAAIVFDRHGYVIEHVGSSQYNGVAIASQHPLSGVERSGDFGVEVLDREPRLICCTVGGPWGVRVVSAYVPHGREVGHLALQLQARVPRRAGRCRATDMGGLYCVRTSDRRMCQHIVGFAAARPVGDLVFVSTSFDFGFDSTSHGHPVA